MARAVIAARSYLRGFWIALDRLGCALFNGDADLTMSQTVGLAVLGRDRWYRHISPVLSLMNNERHHGVRSLYGDTGLQLFPDRMPVGSPVVNPYPGLVRFF